MNTLTIRVALGLLIVENLALGAWAQEQPKINPPNIPTTVTPVAEVVTPEVQKIIHEAAWQAVQEQMELEKARIGAKGVKTSAH